MSEHTLSPNCSHRPDRCFGFGGRRRELSGPVRARGVSTGASSWARRARSSLIVSFISRTYLVRIVDNAMPAMMQALGVRTSIRRTMTPCDCRREEKAQQGMTPHGRQTPSRTYPAMRARTAHGERADRKVDRSKAVEHDEDQAVILARLARVVLGDVS